MTPQRPYRNLLVFALLCLGLVGLFALLPYLGVLGLFILGGWTAFTLMNALAWKLAPFSKAPAAFQREEQLEEALKKISDSGCYHCSKPASDALEQIYHPEVAATQERLRQLIREIETDYAPEMLR